MPLYVVHQCPTVEEWMEYDANVVLSLPGIYKKRHSATTNCAALMLLPPPPDGQHLWDTGGPQTVVALYS